MFVIGCKNPPPVIINTWWNSSVLKSMCLVVINTYSPKKKKTMLMMIFRILVVPCFLIWAWRMVNWLWYEPKRTEKSLRAQGYDGNSYRLLHGDTKDMASMIMKAKSKPIKLTDDIVPRVLPLHHHVINKYGKNSFIWIGPVARVIIMEPELIKEILFNNNTFKKPIPNPLANFLVCGLSGYEGHKWAKHRKIINPAFYSEKLKLMLPAMHTSCMEMIKKLEKLKEEMSTGGGVVEIDVKPYFEDLTCEVILRTAFGSNYEEGGRVFELQKEQAELTRQVLQSVYIPGWRFIPTKRNRRLKQINNKLGTLLKCIIQQREMNMAMEKCPNNDLLGILLKSNQKEMKENGNNFGMSIDEVIEECKMFFFAGQESTSNLLSWTLLLLSIHRTWQERARQEVLNAFGKGAPDFEGLSSLKVLTMILYEVLRLYPPAIIFNRIIYEETKLGDKTLPPGVHVLLPVLLVHHDQELWGEDVKEFKPERFSEGIAKATKNRLMFFPFSSGPRICIGNNFALMEAKIVLSMLLQRFSFDISPSYTHCPSNVVSLQPQSGVHLMLRKT